MLVGAYLRNVPAYEIAALQELVDVLQRAALQAIAVYPDSIDRRREIHLRYAREVGEYERGEGWKRWTNRACKVVEYSSGEQERTRPVK